MGHDHIPVEIEAAQIERSEQGWNSFVKYGKWFTLHVIAIVVLMAIFLI